MEGTAAHYRLAALAVALLGLNLLAGAGLAGLAATAGAACAGLGVVAWLLGLRHAFDADHIAAIDNVTRRLRQQGRRPIAVGLFFSLGHSTVVLGLTLLLVIGAHRTQGLPAWLGEWGVPASLLASAVFLTVIGALNAASLRALRRPAPSRASVFDRVTDSRAMFPLGLLFGLNLDTAAEVVLLALSASAVQGAGLPPWAVLAFPLLFMAGMAAADSAEGLLMLRLYDWAQADADRTLLLNTTTTALSALLALGVAALQWVALARWAGWPIADADLAAGLPGAALGLGATVLMTALWAAARWRRLVPAVARLS